MDRVVPSALLCAIGLVIVFVGLLMIAGPAIASALAEAKHIPAWVWGAVLALGGGVMIWGGLRIFNPFAQP